MERELILTQPRNREKAYGRMANGLNGLTTRLLRMMKFMQKRMRRCDNCFSLFFELKIL